MAYGREEYFKQSIPNMYESSEEREMWHLPMRSLKERVKKGEAGEGGRHQILRREGQPLNNFKQEAGGYKGQHG